MLRFLWLLTVPITAFRGWEVSVAAASSVLERIGFALTVSLFPVAVGIVLAQAQRHGKLKEHTILPWWCVAALTLLLFPVFFGALSIDYELANGRSIAEAVALMLAWTAPHMVALTLVVILTVDESRQLEPVAVDTKTDSEKTVTTPAVVAPPAATTTPSIPMHIPHYLPGTAPNHLKTAWQLSQKGLNPGGPPRGWLLLSHGPGMFLYDVDEAAAR